MSISPEALRNEIRELILDVAEIKAVGDDVEFKDAGIDSMMGVEIVSAIERKYGVRFEDEELNTVNTLNATVAAVLSKLPS